MIQSCILLYVDPGSGSYLIQMIIAAILGTFVLFQKPLVEGKGIFLETEKRGCRGRGYC